MQKFLSACDLVSLKIGDCLVRDVYRSLCIQSHTLVIITFSFILLLPTLTILRRDRCYDK